MPRTMNPLTSLAIAAALLVPSACATSTPYQPLGTSSVASGGYSDVQLAEDRYRVIFAGNMLTSRERVESYLLFRSAELTLERGFDWFLVQDKEMDHVIEREIRADPYFEPWYGREFGQWRPYWRYRDPDQGWSEWDPYHGDPFWTQHVDVTTVERFEATAEIKLGRGEVPPGQGQYFHARRVISEIGPKVEYPED